MLMAKKSAKPAAMSPETFRELLASAYLNQTQAAVRLDVNRRTVLRWLAGTTNISAANAALIRSKIKAR